MVFTAGMGQSHLVLAVVLRLGIPPAAPEPVRAHAIAASQCIPPVKPSSSTVANAVQNPRAALHALLLAVNETGP